MKTRLPGAPPDELASISVRVLFDSEADFVAEGLGIDGHIRFEGDSITVDLFDSMFDVDAHLDSADFENTLEGRAHLQEWLRLSGIAPFPFVASEGVK